MKALAAVGGLLFAVLAGPTAAQTWECHSGARGEAGSMMVALYIEEGKPRFRWPTYVLDSSGVMVSLHHRLDDESRLLLGPLEELDVSVTRWLDAPIAAAPTEAKLTFAGRTWRSPWLDDGKIWFPATADGPAREGARGKMTFSGTDRGLGAALAEGGPMEIAVLDAQGDVLATVRLAVPSKAALDAVAAESERNAATAIASPQDHCSSYP